MKRLFITLLTIASFCGTVSAQGISVESFELLPTDLTAILSETQEIDQNGEVAALIKMVTTQTGFVIDGGMMGIVKTKQETAELWIYVPHGIRRIVIKHQQLGQLEYYFPIPIEKGHTYRMVLTTDELIVVRRPRQGTQGDSLTTALAGQQAEAVQPSEATPQAPTDEPSAKPHRPKRPYRYKHFSVGGGIIDERLAGDEGASIANLGFYVKGDYDLHLVGPLSFRPGLRFDYNTEEHEKEAQALLYNIEGISKTRWTDICLDVPLPFALNFRFSDNFAVGLFAGPMCCFGSMSTSVPISYLGIEDDVSYKSSGFYFMLTSGFTIDIMNTVRLTGGYDPGTYYRKGIYSQKLRRSCLHLGLSILF